MFQNFATSLILCAFDATTGLAKTGDSANITGYRTLDGGTTTVLGTPHPAEQSATFALGAYRFTLTAPETNGYANFYSAVSTTANIQIVPLLIYTEPGLPSFSGTCTTSGGNNTLICSTLTASQAQVGYEVMQTSGSGVGNRGIIDSFDVASGTITLGPISSPNAFTWFISNPAVGTTFVIFPRPNGSPVSVSDFWADAYSGTRTISNANGITSTGATIPLDANGNVITSGGSGGGFHGGISL